ncbi:MAG: hypothetical protein IJV62_05130 [Eggerthellaceae bacterium]|nr:hypothetical protein [Eggerthellaceae bacterium]
MTKIIDHVAFLAEEIGPRPSGTEEEQQAALYIADRLQKDARLNVSIEDFGASINANAAKLICYAVSIVSALLSIFFPIVSLPAAILSLVALVTLFMETFLERPVLSRLFVKGISQNVVGRYTPPVQDANAAKRLRKVVIVANYDSAKEQPFARESFLPAVHILQIATVIAAAVIPFILLIKGLFMGNIQQGSTASGFTSALLVLGIIFLILPIIRILVDYVMGYNDAANSNASGVGVMLETARLVGNGLVQNDTQTPADAHSVEQLIEAGVVPDGTTLIDARDISPEASLAAAKAAIAAMTGQASTQEFTEVLAQGAEEAQLHAELEAAEAAKAQDNIEGEADGQTVPDWFKSAQQKANKTGGMPAVEGFRSRYADVPLPGDEQGAIDTSEDETTATRTEEASAETTDIQAQEGQVGEGSALPQGKLTAEQSAESVAVETDVQNQDSPQIQERVQSAASFIDGTAEDATAQARGETQAEANATTEGPYDADTQDIPTYKKVTEEELQASAQEAQADMHAAQMSLFDLDPSAQAASSVPELDVPADASVTLTGESDEASMSADSFIFNTSAEANAAAVTSPQEIAEPVNPLVRTNRLSDDEVLSVASEAKTHSIAATQFIPTINPESQAFSTSRMATLPQVNDDSSNSYENDPFADIAPQHDEADEADVNVFAKIADKIRGIRLPFQKNSGAAPSRNNRIARNADETTGWAAVDSETLSRDNAQTVRQRMKNDDEWLGGAFDNIRARIPENLGQRMKEGIDSVTSKVVTRGEGSTNVEVDHGVEGNEQPTDAMAPIIISDKGIEIAEESAPNAVEGAAAVGSADAWISGSAQEPEAAVTDEEIKPGIAGNQVEEDAEGVAVGVTDVAEETKSTDDSEFTMRDTKADIEDIYTFMAGAINTEIWFVGLGSQLAGGQGIRAFMAEHADEMRGAIVLNLESLGAGNLSCITAEGSLTQGRASARLRRFMRKAAQSVGITLNETKIDWRESPASYAQKHNMQAITFAGMEGSKPAGCGERDDVLDNISEDQLQLSAKMVVEFLKSI